MYVRSDAREAPIASAWRRSSGDTRVWNWRRERAPQTLRAAQRRRKKNKLIKKKIARARLYSRSPASDEARTVPKSVVGGTAQAK